ncbi:MAG: flagellar biosynthesis anti-sigma factor FlgM [Proteobacteria bacterium]|nr:flagellar biosynthesis anti-sigma factor FlgM [Pseudomonadota bacterium]
MKITNTTGKYDNQVYVKEMTENKRLDQRETQAAEKKQETAKGDTVSLSTASKDLQTAKAAAESAPEIRAEKVEELRTAIKEGTYEVNPDKIADKMVGSIISDIV